MFGWIDRVWQWGIANIGGTIVSWVRDLIHGIWGFLVSIFGNVTDAWNEMFTAGHWLWRMTIDFAGAVWYRFYHLLHIYIPHILGFLGAWLHRIQRFIDYVFDWVTYYVAWLVKKIEHEIGFVIWWVIHHIWRPLRRDILTVWKWISHDGRILWYYITHPEKLIELTWDALIHKLESEAWKIGARLGRFFLGLILHNVKRFVLLIEDIIMALI